MAITVRFIGSLRASLKKSELSLVVKKTLSLKRFMENIIKKNPKLEAALISPELNDPRLNALILVNGKEISVLNGMNTVLKDGDELTIVPVVHGG
jgi:molybdopterin converting factor small subunit